MKKTVLAPKGIGESTVAIQALAIHNVLLLPSLVIHLLLFLSKQLNVHQIHMEIAAELEFAKKLLM